MEEVNRINRAEDLPEIEMGIALNTGEVVVGNIGSEQRTKYGAVGSHVNLTARIESFTLGGQVLVSDATLREAGGDIRVGASQRVEAKGFSDPIVVHELEGMGGETPLMLRGQESPLVELARPVPISFAILEGKLVGNRQHRGEVVRLSPKCAEVRTDAALEPMQNLKMQWFDSTGRVLSAEVYGKAVGCRAEGEGLCRIRFTSLPPEIEAFIAELLPVCARPA
jgi:adenylate cyclase